jgi:hypothetical protein
MEQIIFTDKIEMEEYRAKMDKELGYPESLESFRHVGVGIHCDFEVGRAHHYATEVVEPKEAKSWALPLPSKTDVYAKVTEVNAEVAAKVDATELPKTATVVAGFPREWFPEMG